MTVLRSRAQLVFLIMILLVLGGGAGFSMEAGNSGTDIKEDGPAGAGLPVRFADLQNQIDADRDGFITQAEWNQFFLKADDDKDARLSMQEIAKSLRPQQEDAAADSYSARIAAFTRLDADNNSAVSLSEWPGRKRTFRYLDLNHDGVISKEEFTSRNALWWNLAFEDLDFDGNRIITRSEWMDSDREFDRLDRNRNGGIERKEFYARH